MTRMRLSLRMLLLIGAAMAPVVVVLFYNLYELHRVREQEVRGEAYHTGQLAALEMQRIISGMENVLQTVSSAPAIQDPGSPRCNELLARAAKRLSGVVTLGLIGLDGTIKCRHDGQGIGTSVADRPYFQEVLKSGGFAIGNIPRAASQDELCCRLGLL